MDTIFHPSIRAIKSGDLDALRALLDKDPSLATARSSKSHPTLLQCLTLEGVDVPNAVEMAKLLIAGGADINEALGAAASIDNVEIAKLLLDCGACINGTKTWSPMEEALYWNNRGVIELLLERGATVHNLRMAAALGRIDLIKGFFESDGSLKPEAGKIDWPFGELTSNTNCQIKDGLEAKVSQWTNDRQDLINNAFVYACMHNQGDAAVLLLEQGAQIDAIPPGFDYSGTGLHYAAFSGHRKMVDLLIERGANPSIRDTKVNSTPSGWADHAGHKDLSQHLDELAGNVDKE